MARVHHEPTIEQLIERSSLGTPEAVRMRRSVPRDVVQRVLDRASAMIVYPPTAGTGLRHVVVAGSERTLCGINVDNWFTERRSFDPKTIGCLRCKAAWERKR
jgi:hypothetical protein